MTRAVRLVRLVPRDVVAFCRRALAQPSGRDTREFWTWLSVFMQSRGQARYTASELRAAVVRSLRHDRLPPRRNPGEPCPVIEFGKERCG